MTKFSIQGSIIDSYRIRKPEVECRYSMFSENPMILRLDRFDFIMIGLISSWILRIKIFFDFHFDAVLFFKIVCIIFFNVN